MSNQLAWPELAGLVQPKSGTGNGKYVSLKAVADRWACDRSTVRRNLEAAGVKAFCLGHGKHGIVRYLLKDIEDYERRCREP
jgi:hypothetical protein